MKSNILILFSVIATTISTSAGVQISGGGGDGYAIEFTQLGGQVFEALDAVEPVIAQWDQIDTSKMKKTLQEAQVQSTSETLTLKGKTVSAINNRIEKRIVFNRQDWKSMAQYGRVQLVLHETLGLTYGPERDQDFQLSSKLLDHFKEAGIEAAALATARANVWGGEKYRVLPERTKILKDYDPKDEQSSRLLEICIQTFENNSPDSVRIYQVELNSLGPIRKIEWVSSEGPVGP